MNLLNETMWICIHTGKKNSLYDLGTLAYRRKVSIEQFERTSIEDYKWNEAYKNGWRCIKVRIHQLGNKNDQWWNDQHNQLKSKFTNGESKA